MGGRTTMAKVRPEGMGLRGQGNGIQQGAASDRRTLLVASGAHVLHDGFTDLLYVMLTVWQAEFGLGFAQVGAIRATYAGAMAGFQVPAGILGERIGGRALLALGTAIAAASFMLAGVSGNIWWLGCALLIGGIGASVQHPIASSLVSRAFEGPRSRAALGTYNFAGDIGKMAFPAITAGLLIMMPWRSVVMVLAALGFLAALAMWLLLPRQPLANGPLENVNPAGNANANGEAPVPSGASASSRASIATRGFSLLLSIGIIDSATRMGFLTFLPFLLAAKGASLPSVGLALTLIFAGGAAGKLVCAWLGQRFGVLRTVCITEGCTALGIIALLPMQLGACLVLLPLIGVALNGTSSVLYGSVPELVSATRRERAFSIFYTGTIGAGAVAPALYGLFSDALGVSAMMALIAGVVMLTFPLAWLMNRECASIQETNAGA